MLNLTSQKTEIAKSACEPKMTRSSCRRRTGEAPPRAEEFCGLITADHKVLSKEGESRNNHQYAVVVQDLATQWIQSYPCETKIHRRRKRVGKSFSGRHTSQKFFFFQTIHWSLANLVKIYHGIIEFQHFIDPRQMTLLKEPYEE